MSSTQKQIATTQIEYDWIPDVEDLDGYAPGGFHPVKVGEIYDERYQIVDKVGFGGYSTVWLARDIVRRRYVALKAGMAGRHSKHEIGILQALHASRSPEAGRSYIPELFSHFQVEGPNGITPFYAMTPASATLQGTRFPGMCGLTVSRALCKELAMAILFIHSAGYVHGDLHLNNVLVALPQSFHDLNVEQYYEKYGKPETVPITRKDKKPIVPHAPEVAVVAVGLAKNPKTMDISDAEVFVSDFGQSFPISSSQSHLGKDCCTPLFVRPPEARFEPDAPLSTAADIWQLGMAFWDILSMKPLCSRDNATVDEIISQNVDLIGPLPSPWRETWSEFEAAYYDTSGRRKRPGQGMWPSLEVAYAEGLEKYRLQKQVGALDERERAAFLALIRGMLTFKPEDRLSVQQVLESDWMTHWVMPNPE